MAISGSRAPARARPKIVLNALALRPGGGGVQTYTRELLRSLPDVVEADLAAVVQVDAVGELPETVVALRRRRADGLRRTWEGLRPVGPADLVHGLDVDIPWDPPRGFPGRSGAPTVATVHDLAVFDVPWAFSARRGRGKRLSTRRALRRADRLVAVSAFTAERVRRRFGREAVVVHEAPRTGFAPPPEAEVAEIRARLSLPGDFVLHVGDRGPRKDLPTLAAACREAGLPLVLAGPGGAGPTGAGPVRDLGYVAAGDLPALYGAATVVAYVSRYEGFALPPVEALACGAAVVATRVADLAEIAPEAIEFVPAGDVGAQARTLRDVALDAARRAERGAAGRLAVAHLSWPATAAATADVYHDLLGSGR